MFVTTTNYFIKWPSSKAFEDCEGGCDKVSTQKKLWCNSKENSNYSNYDPQFTNNVIEEFMNKLTIKHCITTTYNPNMNNLVEFTNKVLCNIFHNEMKNVKT